MQEVCKVIQELGRQEKTILLVEQKVHQALKIADYGYVLVNGRIVHQGTGKDLEQDPPVREVYLGL